ncbi:hypothetical protein LMH87_005548 [Akanthomyces muscarius]|uniref:HCNGP-like protein n=1 Tax=Akanthomyces muscarius TaxID=2231603 RepID=A0A9W8QLK4_AKAMU|nr:hypothetical protein LMH87_005548 [Akanthomyces muscarius]KAJ4163844.1 hypothetical protein LMH87_005548 [Akanthomyces muscarius]
MAGLVSYASSDEDSADEQPQMQAPAPSQQQTQPQSQPSQPATATAPKPAPSNAKPPQPQETPAPGAALPPPSGAALGPSLPPMDTPTTISLPEPSSDDHNPPAAAPPPSSPYTTTRSLIHDLTLPSVPNFDIPPSPPGSPSPSSGTTNAKLEQFLSLKRKGTHFNAKLEQSSALRNPALTDKLLQFVDIPPPGGGERGLQYTTTLSGELWSPDAFPAWAFREKLRKGRDKVAKEREAARAAPGRSGVEFVSGATTAVATTGGGGLSKGEKRRGGWQ